MNKQSLSRRDFLKAAAAAGSSALAAGVLPQVVLAQDTITLTFGHHWEAAFRPVQEEFDNAFMERHPEINFEVTYNTWADHNTVVPVWAAAGTLPDIIYVHGSRVAPWTAEGIISPIEELVEADTEFNVEGIWEEALRLYRVDGLLHGIPYDHGPLILGYNKDMFDAAGMDYPDETWTMETLQEAALALSDPENLIWGFSGELPDLGNGGSGASLRPWGAVLMNEEETQLLLDSPEAKTALEFWYNLTHDLHGAPSATEAEGFGDNPWQNGRTAMAVVPSWETPSLMQFASFAWDVAPWPEGPAGRSTGAFGSGFSITTASQQREAAWTYLSEYLSTEGMIQMWGVTGRGSPARKDALDSWLTSPAAPEHGQYYIDALENYAVTDPPFLTSAAAQVLDIVGREATLLRLGEKSVDDVIATIMGEAQPILDAVEM
jgi:multiple sugar transport system substrate-binding protein